MIEDESFDYGFLPAYEAALKDRKPVFTYAGSKYSLSYGRIIVNYVNAFKHRVDKLKATEL